jgi:hypothetical protein
MVKEKRLVNAEDLKAGRMSEADVKGVLDDARRQLALAVDKSGPLMPAMTTRCWQWKGGAYGDGYGRLVAHLGDAHLTMPVYHWVWMLAAGSLPARGFNLHHLCRNKLCANPAHLAMMLVAGHSNLHHMTLLGKCVRGHQFDEVNPLIDGRGYRRCRECAEEDRLRYKARQTHPQGISQDALDSPQEPPLVS